MGAHGPRATTAVLAVAWITLPVLGVVAGLNGLRSGSAAAYIAADVTVGFVLGICGLVSPVAVTQRLLLWSVGAAWLLATPFPVPTLHQALLVLVLAWFPSGMPRAWAAAALAVVAAPVAVGLGGQILAGTAFLLAAAVSAVEGRRLTTARLFPILSGVGLAATLLVPATMHRWLGMSPDPRLFLAMWQIALVTSGLAHVVTARVIVSDPVRVVRALLLANSERPEDARAKALEAVLAHVMRDRGLRVRLPHDADPDKLDAAAARTNAGPGSVSTVSALLTDPEVARALDETLGQVARSVTLSRARQRHVGLLRAARRRLVLAETAEREDFARELRADVLTELSLATHALDNLSKRVGAQELTVAAQELSRARDVITAVLTGVAPIDLGEGRVVEAVRQLARDLPLDVEIVVVGDVSASHEVESAVFYVCSEALSNIVKHAGAHHVRVGLTGQRDLISLSVSDDGAGGADPSGSGLAGLGERVVALNGTWSVEDNADGQGTTVSVSMPRLSRSASRARGRSREPARR